MYSLIVEAVQTLTDRDKDDLVRELYDKNAEGLIRSKIRDRISQLTYEAALARAEQDRIDLTIEYGGVRVALEFKQRYDFDCVLALHADPTDDGDLQDQLADDVVRLQRRPNNVQHRILVVAIVSVEQMSADAAMLARFKYEAKQRRAERLLAELPEGTVPRTRAECVTTYLQQIFDQLGVHETGLRHEMADISIPLGMRRLLRFSMRLSFRAVPQVAIVGGVAH